MGTSNARGARATLRSGSVVRNARTRQRRARPADIERAAGGPKGVRAKPVGGKIISIARQPAPQRSVEEALRPTPWLLGQASRLASACSSVAVGLHTCAKHTKSGSLGEATRALAEEQRLLADEVLRLGTELGWALPNAGRQTTTSERLRWEWLAATASVLDGSPDVRLLSECTRMMRLACDIAATLEATAREVSDARLAASSDVQSLKILLDRSHVYATQLAASSISQTSTAGETNA